jgi:hypothetical protein
MKTQGLRYWYDNDEVYVARDRVTPSGGLRPEHATWHRGRIRWVSHDQGGSCSPLTLPPKKYGLLQDLLRGTGAIRLR